ncbi:MAG: hypothetical protein ABIM50_13045 [Novosphingobium sp.]
MSELRWPGLLERVVFASFLLSLLFGVLLPIYTDEVAWRMQLRAGLDGGIDRMISDICGPNTNAAPPLFMMPFRFVSAWLNLNFPNPLYVRTVGVGCAIVWAFLMRALIGRIAADNRQRNLLRALAFGLLGMGVLPLMLVMSRPDQIVLLAMTGAVFAAVIAAQRGVTGALANWTWPLAIAALGVAAISYHLKGVLIAPLILVCIFLCGSGRRSLAPRILAMLLFAGLAAQGAHYWVERFRCPDDPVLAERLAKQNIASALVTEGDWRHVGMTALIGANPNNYIMLAEARKFPMSDWLPRGQIDNRTSIVRFIAMGLAWNLTTVLAMICLVLALRQRWRERRIDLATAVPVALAGLAVVWGISQRARNDYEIMIALPMLALFCVFSLSAVPWRPLRTRQLGVGVAIIALCSLVGQVDIARRYYPLLRAAADQTGYVFRQPFSVSAYGFGTVRQTILDTAKLCGIGARGRAQRPMVDDITYFAMIDSWRPFHRFGVLETWNGSIKDPVAYLHSRGSEGMIVDCRALSPALQTKAIRNGDYCCVSTR